MNKKVFSSVTEINKTSDKMYKIPAYKELGLKEEKKYKFYFRREKRGLKIIGEFSL